MKVPNYPRLTEDNWASLLLPAAYVLTAAYPL